MNPNYRPTANSALILSPDPLAGALVGAAVELVGVQAVFPMADEAPKAALRRLRPKCVLLSHDEPSATDDAFLGPAMMTGSRLFLFGEERRLQPLQPIVTRYQLEVIVLPRDLESLRERLTGESESSPRPRETTVR